MNLSDWANLAQIVVTIVGAIGTVSTALTSYRKYRDKKEITLLRGKLDDAMSAMERARGRGEINVPPQVREILAQISKRTNKPYESIFRAMLTPRRLTRVEISRPAGAGILAVLRVFVSQRNLERVFGQAVADMREECIEAIAARKPWRYRGAWFRGHLAIAFTVVAFLTASVLKRVVEIWKAV